MPLQAVAQGQGEVTVLVRYGLRNHVQFPAIIIHHGVETNRRIGGSLAPNHGTDCILQLISIFIPRIDGIRDLANTRILGIDARHPLALQGIQLGIPRSSRIRSIQVQILNRV